MLSYEQVKERARKRQQQNAQQVTGKDKGKTLSFEEVKDRARQRLAQNTQENAASVEKWFSDVRNLGSRVQEYYSGDGYKTPESSFNAEIDKYIGQAGKMLSYIKANQQAYEDYDGLIQMHTDTVSGLQNMKSDIEAANNYFAQFESPEAYKEAAYYQEYGDLSYEEIKKKLDIMPKDAEAYEWLSAYAPTVMTEEDYDNEISSVEAELTTLEAVLEEYNRLVKGVSTSNPNAYANTRLAELRRQYGSEKDIEAKIEEIKATKWEYENGKKYNTLPLNENFAEVSTQVADSPTRGWGVEAFGKWYGQGDEIYDYINDIDGARQKIRESGDKNDGDAAIYHYSLMSKDEIAKYNYLYNTSGKDAANEYLAYLENDLMGRRQKEVATKNSEFATEHPFWADAYSIGANLASGSGIVDIAWQNAVKGVKEAVTGEYAGPINYNSAAMTPNTISTSIRSTRAQNIANKYGVIEINEEEHPFWSKILNGKSFGDVYQLGMSMADSAAIVALSPVLGSSGTVLLGGSAGTQSVLNAVNNGATDEEALAMGLASGIFEMLFEKYSLETLLTKGGKTFIGKALRQSLAEGSEEFFTSAANNIADILIMAEKSGYLKPYLDAGMTENEALQKALIDMGIDMGWDFVGGMFSGFIMGGASTPIMNRVNTEAQYRNASAPIKQTISMADFASQHSPVWNNVDYNDTAKKTSIMQETHDRMVADGAVVNVSSEIMESVDQAYPDLRDMKKKERTPILKTAMAKLKEDIRQFLNGFKNQQFEFEVNGKVLEAKLYNTGINEVLEKVTKQKASMLYSTEDIFRNAQYLYSTQDYAGDPNVYRWNYFYTPIQIGDETVGVRIAVRDVATPGESQIYNWGIKKDTSLDDEGRGTKDRISHGVSSDVSNNSISQTTPGVNNETVLQSTGEAVNFENFTKVENGKATVLANGKEVDAADVSLGDEGTDLVFHSVIGFDNMTASGANTIMQAYKKGGVSAGAFGQGAAVAYRWGYHGFSETELAKQKYAGKLTEVQRDVIYQAGKEAGIAATEADQNRVDKTYTEAQDILEQTGKESSNEHRAILDDGITLESLSESQRVSYELADKVAQAAKVGVRVYIGEPGEFGYYDHASDTVCLNLNAKNKSRVSMMAFTLGHELVHRAKQGSPKKYKAFADFLVQEYGKQGVSMEKLIAEQIAAAKRHNVELSEDKAFEEVVCDACQRMLLDTNAGQKLAEFGAQSEQNKGILKELKRWISQFMDRLRKVFKGVDPDSMAAKEFSKFDKTVQQTLADMFVDMTVDAGEKLSTIQNAFGKSIGEGRSYALPKDFNSPTYEELIGKDPVNIIDIGRNTKGLSYADLKKQVLENARIRKVFDAPYHNRDTGVSIFLTEQSFSHAFSNLTAEFGEDTILAMDRIAEVICEAVLTHIDPPKNPRKAESRVFTFFAAIKGENGIEPIKLKVKEYSGQAISEIPQNIQKYFENNGAQEIHNRLYDAVALEVVSVESTKKESGASASVANREKRLGAKGTPNSTIKIADLFALVNGEAKKYIPLPVEEKLFKLSTGEDTSPRALLANALESVAQNESENYWIKQYREKISQLNEQEQKLHEQRAQIRELSFAKGKRDTAKIKELQLEAVKTENRINILDKQLLRIEAAKPLRELLESEKAKAKKRAEQKAKRDLEAYRKAERERSEKREKEIREGYQESRKRATESRHRTEMRHKIQKVVKKLNDLLLKETKDKHIPENLKNAVAEALDAVNMDTVGAEERLAKYDALIAEATDPDVIASLEETRERIANAGDRLSERMAKLKAAYDSIKSGAETESASIYDEVIAEKIQETLELVGDTALRDMNMQQLEAVYEMYTMVSKSISNANKAFKMARAEGIRELGAAVGNEITAAGGSHPYSVKALEGVKRFDWNNQKPVYAFERMGSKTLSELYENVRAGEDTWARDVTEAKAFYQEQAEKYGYDQWDMKKQYTFASTTGHQFALTLEQIMSLYAYAKREQAGEHLSKGGFVFDSAIEVVQKKHGIPVKYKVNTASAYNLSGEILADIIGTLTEEQAEFVDAMQEYLSAVMGEKGNEVSMALYDVKLFKERNYFPLRTAKQYIQQKNEAVSELRLKNSGFSKKTVPHANNPVILGNFTDVWAGHVNDMSMYHAFVLPLEDFNRVYNYSEAAGLENADTESVKARIQNAYGKQANDYIEQLLKDLNGGARQDPRETATKKLVSNFKKAAVMGSLSVIVQQPTALVRAMAVVDGRYFGIMPITHGLIRTVNAKKHRQLWSEVKKYAPVAVIKEMGHFDTNMGRSTQDFIKAKEYKGLETVKGILSDSGYRDEVISRPAALADEIAWVAIWEAVKKETADKHKDLQTGSEAFLRAVGKRFTEVVTKTQVYDSVLSRSANMRVKSGMMDMLTSFMAEPTTSINMLQDALLKAKRGDKKGAARAIGAVYGSVILNAALVSFVYAMRDDDEDETFLEKYLSRTIVEVLDGMNPLTYIPFMKDV